MFGRKNFFMECMDEWIKRVIECFVVVFNFDLVFGLCVMEFDLRVGLKLGVMVGYLVIFFVCLFMYFIKKFFFLGMVWGLFFLLI